MMPCLSTIESFAFFRHYIWSHHIAASHGNSSLHPSVTAVCTILSSDFHSSAQLLVAFCGSCHLISASFLMVCHVCSPHVKISSVWSCMCRSLHSHYLSQAQQKSSPQHPPRRQKKKHFLKDKEHHQRQSWENLLTNRYRSLDAVPPIRLFAMSSCERLVI